MRKIQHGVLSAYIIVLALFTFSCAEKIDDNEDSKTLESRNSEVHKHTSEATFGAGCFWCVEAIFQNLEGVDTVVSGYSGGHKDNPTYKEVCTENTGHAEVIQIYYDSSKISFKDLLEVFWQTHDPTTLNKQGNDEGPQYRSVVFYRNDDEKEIATHYKNELNKQGVWDKPIVTEIAAFEKFWPAEEYHQNYYNDNKGRAYCQYVITPKVDKFKKAFAEKLKK